MSDVISNHQENNTIYGYSISNCTNCTPSEQSDLKFFQNARSFNAIACLMIILVGVVGNALTLCVLKFKRNQNSKKASIMRLNSVINSKSSLSSSQSYILSLAVSDSLFLISHLIEAIIPNIAITFNARNYFDITDRNNFACKVTLYIRNASRISSSYLIVFFALERLMVVSHPLKRLQFHYKKYNRNLIICVFMASFLLTSYTPVISGLRKKVYDDIGHEYTCDTKVKYDEIYDYITIVYIIVVLLVPIVATCYLNLYIVKILMTRKNRVLRHFFRSVRSPPSSSQELSLEHDHSSSQESKAKQSQNIGSIVSNNSYPLGGASTTSTQLEDIQSIRRTSTYGRNSLPQVLACPKTPQPKRESTKIKNNKSNSNPTDKPLSINQDIIHYRAVRKSTIASNASSFRSHSNHFHYRTSKDNIYDFKNCKIASVGLSVYDDGSSQLRSCCILQKLFRKLKEAGRGTYILILISLFFVLLNIPYVIAWLCFFVPFKSNLLNKQSQFDRFGLVNVFEVLHILNYSINFFLYCMSSKLFRQELKLLFSFKKPCKHKFSSVYIKKKSIFDDDQNIHHNSIKQEIRQNTLFKYQATHIEGTNI